MNENCTQKNKFGNINKFILMFRCLTLFVTFSMSLMFSSRSAWAGPPFFTDDPEPAEYRHWEVYLATQWSQERGEETSATLPHIDVNYGIFPDTQLSVVLPMAYSSSHDSSKQYGLGDLEIGLKYRFIHEDDKGWTPQVSIFPLVDLPTGDSLRGLGEGHIKMFFPIWVQKSWGPWTTYGGGGYWYHRGKDNKNYWFAGWLLQREISKMLTLGAEVFNTSPKEKGESDETGFNVGGSFNLSEEHHILFSAGQDFKGPNTFFAYLSFQWTFGPSAKKETSWKADGKACAQSR